MKKSLDITGAIIIMKSQYIFVDVEKVIKVMISLHIE